MRSKILMLLFLLSSFLASTQNLYFPPVTGNSWDTIAPDRLNWCQPRIDSLYDLLDENNTKAFILLKDGKIVLEKYFGTHTQSSLWYWASAGKTLTAFMVGIAQQDNFLSIHDTTSKYLGQGWTNLSIAQEQKITIKHQLTMTSGLDDGVPDVHCTIDTCLNYKADAGTRWAYHNAPYTLLDKVIESATGVTLNNYIDQKVKGQTGITGSFATVGYNNVFFSNARSMARFGLLILNKGNWNGNQIMTDTAYFSQMTTTSQIMNEAYGYLWWLNSASSFMIPQTQFKFNGSIVPNAPPEMIAALGKNGQFINVVPSQGMVWIRMGDSPDGNEVPIILNDKIWEQINLLTCASTNIEKGHPENPVITIAPNPAGSYFRIDTEAEIKSLECYDMLGRYVHLNVSGVNGNYSIAELNNGVYLIRIKLDNGQIILKKFIKE